MDIPPNSQFIFSLNSYINFYKKWWPVYKMVVIKDIVRSKWKWKSLTHAHSLWPSKVRILEWVAYPFSRRSSQPRGQTQVSLIAGGFFTGWATREAQEYWSGLPIPSPVDPPDPGIQPESPALQVDSLPTELWGKTHFNLIASLNNFSLNTVIFWSTWG